MLTVDFDRLGVGVGTSVIDVGCGAGRHSFEAFRRGADVVAFDQDGEELNDVDAILQAMQQQGEAPASAKAEAVKGDALDLPYGDGSFDCVIASEILEHVPQDDRAIDELVRIVKPGGWLAVTVPRWLPEKICWRCPTSITPTRAATSGSTGPMSCRPRSRIAACASSTATTHTHCTRRSGG